MSQAPAAADPPRPHRTAFGAVRARLATPTVAGMLLLLAFAAGLSSGFRAGEWSAGSGLNIAGTPAAGVAADPGPSDALADFVALLARHADGGYDSHSLVAAAAAAAADAAGDRHAALMEPTAGDGYQGRLQGGYGGIGAHLSEQDGQVVIDGVFDDGPADRAGLRDGDVVVAVDGRAGPDTAVDTAAAIRGEPGSEVEVTVVRDGQERSVVVARETVDLPSVQVSVADDGTAVVRIFQFTRSTAGQLNSGLAAAGAYRRVVVDLRGNQGGLLDAGVDVVGELFGQWPAAQVSYRDGRTVSRVGAGDNPVAVPVAAVVDGGTASAAEIVAAAVGEHPDGIVVGSPTVGKGTVQTVEHVAAGYTAVVTMATYRTGAGNPIDGVGVPLDLPVDGDTDPVAVAVEALQ